MPLCSWKVLAKSWLKTTDLCGFSFHLCFHCWNYLVTRFSSSVFLFAQNGNCGALSKSLKNSISYFKCCLCQQWDKLLKGWAGSLLDRQAPHEAQSSFLLLSQHLSCLFSQEIYGDSSNHNIFEFSAFPSSTCSSVPPVHPVASSVGSVHTPVFHPPRGGLLDRKIFTCNVYIGFCLTSAEGQTL